MIGDWVIGCRVLLFRPGRWQELPCARPNRIAISACPAREPWNYVEISGIAIATAVCMSNRPGIDALFGETAREIGILIVVFAPLEGRFLGQAITLSEIGALVVFGLVIVSCGILLEVRE